MKRHEMKKYLWILPFVGSILCFVGLSMAASEGALYEWQGFTFIGLLLVCTVLLIHSIDWSQH